MRDVRERLHSSYCRAPSHFSQVVTFKERSVRSAKQGSSIHYQCMILVDVDAPPALCVQPLQGRRLLQLEHNRF